MQESRALDAATFQHQPLRDAATFKHQPLREAGKADKVFLDVIASLNVQVK